jgi:hypothetical protein
MIDKAIRLLAAGKWQAAHNIVQDDTSPLGYWAHGIVHLQEGDVDNARYWYRKAKRALPSADAIDAEIAAIEKAVAKN